MNPGRPEERVCSDLRLLGAAMENIYQRLKERNLWKLFVNIETVLCPILALWELKGIRVNTQVMEQASNILKVSVFFSNITTHVVSLVFLDVFECSCGKTVGSNPIQIHIKKVRDC